MVTTNISAATATVIKGWSTTVQNFSDLGTPTALEQPKGLTDRFEVEVVRVGT